MGFMEYSLVNEFGTQLESHVSRCYPITAPDYLLLRGKGLPYPEASPHLGTPHCGWTRASCRKMEGATFGRG
jgi:hypothetical protein